MRTMFKPSLIAAVLLAVIIATAVYVATSLFIDDAKEADLIVISYRRGTETMFTAKRAI